MSSLPDLLFPILWVATPIWGIVLLYLLRKKESVSTVWGFLLPQREGAPSHQHHKWLWLSIFCAAVSGLLVFFTLSIPHVKKINLILEEPNLLQQLSHEQKQKWRTHLSFLANSNTKIQVLSPKGEFLIDSLEIDQLFNHKFDQKVHEAWYETTFDSQTPTLVSSLSYAPAQLAFIPLNNTKSENTSGIYGLRASANELQLAVWSKQHKNMELHFGKNKIQLPKEPWQYVSLPEQAIGHELILMPEDDFSLDNTLDTSGFQMQSLKWKSDHNTKAEWKQVLDRQFLWTQHRELNLTHNATRFSRGEKTLNLIDQQLPGFSQVIAPDLFKQLYSTHYLPLSTQHHILEWPLSNQPNVSLLHNDSQLMLWFNEKHIFSAIDENSKTLHHCLNFTSFKSNLNLKSGKLLLNSLYPNLNNPWLIERNHVDMIRPTLSETFSPKYENIWMAMALCMAAILGITLNYLKAG